MKNQSHEHIKSSTWRFCMVKHQQYKPKTTWGKSIKIQKALLKYYRTKQSAFRCPILKNKNWFGGRKRSIQKTRDEIRGCPSQSLGKKKLHYSFWKKRTSIYVGVLVRGEHKLCVHVSWPFKKKCYSFLPSRIPKN